MKFVILAFFRHFPVLKNIAYTAGDQVDLMEI